MRIVRRRAAADGERLRCLSGVNDVIGGDVVHGQHRCSEIDGYRTLRGVLVAHGVSRGDDQRCGAIRQPLQSRRRQRNRPVAAAVHHGVIGLAVELYGDGLPCAGHAGRAAQRAARTDFSRADNAIGKRRVQRHRRQIGGDDGKALATGDDSAVFIRTGDGQRRFTVADIQRVGARYGDAPAAVSPGSGSVLFTVKRNGERGLRREVHAAAAQHQAACDIIKRDAVIAGHR